MNVKKENMMTNQCKSKLAGSRDGYPIGEMRCVSHASLSPIRKSDLCPICGEHVKITSETSDGRLIGSCGDAFPRERWDS